MPSVRIRRHIPQLGWVGLAGRVGLILERDVDVTHRWHASSMKTVTVAAADCDSIGL